MRSAAGRAAGPPTLENRRRERRLLPRARIHTSFFDDATFSDRIDPRRVRRWSLERIVDSRHFRALLPMYPLYFSTLERNLGLGQTLFKGD